MERCFICGGAAFATVCRYDAPDPYERRVGVPAEGYARAWLRCDACGFHLSRYSRSPEVLDALYDEAYREAGAGWRGGASTEDIFRRVVALPEGQSETKARIDWIRAQMEDLARSGLWQAPPPPGRLLDIGGATGVFAWEFQESAPAWRAHVVDRAASGQCLAESLGIPYRRQPYAAGCFGQRFHLVSLIFVLEHLRDPDAILREVRADLEPGGLVYIEVPDAVAFRLKPLDDDIFNACHLWMFDPTSLTRLVARNGFDTLRLQRTRTIRGHYALCLLGGVP
ncbi:MAG: class I SAM-dependent methyltransferase [Alphaproteobacteria bacterium]